MPSLEQLIQSINGRIDQFRDHVTRGRTFGADGQRRYSNRGFYRRGESEAEATSPADEGEKAADG